MPTGLVGQLLVAEFIMLQVTKDMWEMVPTSQEQRIKV